MKRYLPFLIVAFVACATLTSATILYQSKRRPVLIKSEEPVGTGARTRHVLGDSHAAVTLEEFGDFECPPCGNMSEPLNQLQKDFKSNLRVIFRQFPLEMHVHSREAAAAAEAAGLQGRFWEMHDLLYKEQEVWAHSPDARNLIVSYAGILGLDLNRFKKDMESEEVKNRVEADQKEGTLLGVKNTPTIFLNNREIEPQNLNPAGLRAAVEAAIKEKQK